MKLLYVYDQMPETYQAYLLTLLEELQKSTSVKIVSYSNDKRADHAIISYGVKDKLQRLAYKMSLSKNSSLDIKVMREYDIIHIQHSYLFPKLTPFFNENVKKPKIVMTLRGGDTYMKPWLSGKWKDFYKNNSNHVDAFITMSKHQKEYLTRWGVAKNKIHVIPISFGKMTSVKAKHPNSEVLQLVSVFRMCWEKNIEGCIQFAKKIKDKNIPFTYDFYGDGPDLAQLYYLVDKYKLKDNINIKGKVENKVIKKQLRSYDFLVQLSISEALPTTVLEAQSLGLPCIVSKCDGLPESVINNKTAIVNEYYNIDELVNSCINLWKNKNLYHSYSKEAIKNSNENFTTQKEVEKLLNLYANL